jgi:hypothetical protein
VDLRDRVETFDRVVSTVPIPAVLSLLGLAPRARFDTMSVYSLFYAGRLRPRGALLYNFTLGGRWKRLTAFSRYYGLHDGIDYWTVEATTRDRSPAALDALRRDFEEHAGGLGVFEEGPAFLDGHVTEHAYPVFHRGESADVEAERARILEHGIDQVGRQGSFEYLSSDAVASKARARAVALVPQRLGAVTPAGSCAASSSPVSSGGAIPDASR